MVWVVSAHFSFLCSCPFVVPVSPFSVDEYLDCFQFVVIINKIAIKSLVSVF